MFGLVSYRLFRGWSVSFQFYLCCSAFPCPFLSSCFVLSPPYWSCLVLLCADGSDRFVCCLGLSGLLLSGLGASGIVRFRLLRSDVAFSYLVSWDFFLFCRLPVSSGSPVSYRIFSGSFLSVLVCLAWPGLLLFIPSRFVLADNRPFVLSCLDSLRLVPSHRGLAWLILALGRPFLLCQVLLGCRILSINAC